MPTKRSKKVSPGIRGKPMKKGVRSPTAHRTLEQSQAHGAKGTGYQSSPKQKANRKKRGAARKALGLKKGDKADGGHKVSLSKGGSNKKSNLKKQSRKTNRGHGMTRGKKANAGKKVRKR